MKFALSVALIACLAPCARAGDRVAVYVKAAATVGGFTDPSKERQDSVKDLLKRLKDSDSLRVVDLQEEAIIVLEVLDRDVKREENTGVSAIFAGGRQDVRRLTVRLTVGEFSAEFTGDGKAKGKLMRTGYGVAAERVVEQLEEWVKANREHLVVR